MPIALALSFALVVGCGTTPADPEESQAVQEGSTGAEPEAPSPSTRCHPVVGYCGCAYACGRAAAGGNGADGTP